MTFTSAGAVFTYLPALGAAGVLTGSLHNPTTSSSGEFGGEVLALQLNVDFSDADLLANTTPLGDLRLCNFTALPVFNGQTVRQFLATANTMLGGGGNEPYGPTTAAVVARLINNAFRDGTPSTFAQSSLVNGGCGWQQGDLVTFDQANWGTSTTAAGALLAANFSSLYGATDLVVGGIRTMRFSSHATVYSYLPASGLPGVLTFSLGDPTSTSSGEFGGEVVALQLNVDFSDADLLANTTPLGDLRFCNFTAVPVLNGQTVRQFLATANTILGGGSAPYGASTASIVASLINDAFADGTPSIFAQTNLFVGACP